MKTLTYKDLKESKFYMVVVKNESMFNINYVINIKPKTIKRSIEKIEGYSVISVTEISFEEYIINNLEIDKIDVIDDKIEVEFYQPNIFQVYGLFTFDTNFNQMFVYYNLTASEIKEVLRIQGKTNVKVSEYCLSSTWNKIKHLF